MANLEEMKSDFLKAPHNDTVCTLLQHCALPRSIMSPEDALYSAKFFLLLHQVGVPYFSCIRYLDQCFSLVFLYLFP